MLKLVTPSVQYKDSFLEGLAEFQKEGLPWHTELFYDDIASNFETYVRKLKEEVNIRTETLVPQTSLWGIHNGEYVGRIAIRHTLNEALRVVGGHIGYDTRPSFRGQGFATEMLKLSLPIAKSLGLQEVLLTTDDTNSASIRVIEKNGGILRETRIIDPKRPAKRYYWIRLD
jgi:predicted acetyltransferase